MKHHHRRGVTLIEILLSMLVLVIGIVGILAIFPSALQTSKETVQEREALLIAESVKASLTNAMRFADATVPVPNQIITHDMQNGSLTYPVTFPLPILSDGWVRHPGASASNPDTGLKPIPNPTNPELDPAWKLSADGWLNASVDYIQQKNDPTEPYRQFYFSFDVSRVNTLWYRLNQPGAPGGGNWTEATLSPLCKLFEFRINVMREKGINSAGTGGTGTTGSGVVVTPKTHILTITDRISLK